MLIILYVAARSLTPQSLPIGALSLVVISLVLPNRFPHHVEPKAEKQDRPSYVTALAVFLWEADVLGAFLLLTTVVFLVAALEEGGTVNYAWGSGFIIASFISSGVLLMSFILWQWWATKKTTAAVPSFPRTFTHNRILPSALL